MINESPKEEILNHDHPKCVVLVCGTGGHGKSTLFKRILDNQKAKYWFYYDHKSQFSSRYGIQPCFDYKGICEQAASTGIVCFDPSEIYAGRKEEGFLFFCDFIFEFASSEDKRCRGRKILVCDELQQVAFQSKPPELVTLMDDGRCREIDCFFIAQSTNQLHNMVQNQFTEIFSLRQAHEACTSHLETVGFDPETLVKLAPGEFLYRNLTTGEARSGGKAFKIKSTADENLFNSREGESPKRSRGRPPNKPAHGK